MQVKKSMWTLNLSSQERDLLFLLVRGRTTAQAAQTLGLDAQEAEQTLRRLQDRCGIPARHALIARAAIQRWV